MGAPLGDLLVDDCVDRPSIGSHSSAVRVRDAMWKLLPHRALEVSLRSLEQLAELLGACRHTVTEERAHRDLEHECSADRIEVERARVPCECRDDFVDRGVGALHDHRYPAIETSPAERDLHRTAATTMIFAVGDDQ